MSWVVDGQIYENERGFDFYQIQEKRRATINVCAIFRRSWDDCDAEISHHGLRAIGAATVRKPHCEIAVLAGTAGTERRRVGHADHGRPQCSIALGRAKTTLNHRRRTQRGFDGPNAHDPAPRTTVLLDLDLPCNEIHPHCKKLLKDIRLVSEKTKKKRQREFF